MSRCPYCGNIHLCIERSGRINNKHCGEISISRFDRVQHRISGSGAKCRLVFAKYGLVISDDIYNFDIMFLTQYIYIRLRVPRLRLDRAKYSLSKHYVHVKLLKAMQRKQRQGE